MDNTYSPRATAATAHRRRSTLRGLLATAAGLAAMVVPLGTPALLPSAEAVPGVPANRFDLDAVGWYSYRDQSSSAYAAKFVELRDKGYLPLDLDIATDSGYKVGSVWQRNSDGRAWRAKRNLTSAQFSAEWDSAKAAGMRLVEQETYLIDRERFHAGIWYDNTEGYAWASHRGQTNTQFKASFDAHKRAGLMPVDYDEYSTSSGLRYNSVWVKAPAGSTWYFYRGLSSSQYAAKFDALKATHRVLTTDSLRDGSTQRYAGAFVENTNGRGWAALRNMTATSYANNWHRYADLGYRVASFNRYTTSGGVRYAAVWRQDGSRADWALKADVDAAVQEQLDKGVPGISVAVYQNGKPVYLRGFGSADVAGGVWMDSDHVGSLASVSKAVGGVLTMKMVEQGLVDLDDETRDLVPSMPAHHTHTIGQLASNRGCVRHYQSGQDGFTNQPYPTALDAAKEFWDDALVCTPGEYFYSSFGNTLEAAALEAVGDDDIKDLVRTKLTNPYGLGTLGPQTTTGHRMKIYQGAGNTQIPEYNNDWKVLGGGLESSAKDLASFGAELSDGEILTDESLQTMWTPPDTESSYAYGWSTGTEKGTQVVAKDGSWTGTLAYLRLYPEERISIAVLMNSRDKGASATSLGREIGAIVLG